VSEGRYEEAFEVICCTNPFPSVCAHICQRPCEKHCRRVPIDSSVGIRALKRFVVNQVDARVRPSRVVPPPDKARVAVVGAGPAGLTAAYDLRMRGHRVSIFERLERPGGMLNVIPRYRLPLDALDADIEAIVATGIDVTCGCEMGRDTTVAGLIDKGFEAVVVASGLSRSRGIAVPGFGAQRFNAAVPWMADVWLGNKVDVGRRVAVIGGGNVAVDVARTARRLGADYVAMICLENEDEIPAEPYEIELARAEGIDILTRQALKRVFNRDDKIAVVELMSVVSVFDDAGRFRPSYDPSRIRTLNFDMVILSVGQAPDRSWARGMSFNTDARRRILADRDTQVTSHPRVFLAGESLRGPGSAIEAVADGHRVAEIVSRALQTGEVVKPAEDQVVPLDDYPSDVLEKLRIMTSASREAEPFADAEPSLSEADARREGNRCLGCLAGAVIDEAKCASCLTCFRVCPLSAIEIGEPMVANPVRCQACGLCAAVCPGNAITLSCWEADVAAAEDRVPVLESAAPGDASLALLCRHVVEEDLPASRILNVPCLARLKPVDVLRFFQRGYRDVQLYPCARDDCKYGASWANIESVVEQVRRTLADVRSEARIQLVSDAGPGSSAEPSQESPT